MNQLTHGVEKQTNPDLPVPYIFGTKLPGKPIYQVTIDPWFQIFRELEDEGNLNKLQPPPVRHPKSSSHTWCEFGSPKNRDSGDV